MKTLPKAIGTLVLVLVGILASDAAMAQHRGHGNGHGYAHGGGVRFGVSLGVPLYGLGYYPSYYSYPAYAYAAPVYAYPAPVYNYPVAVSSPPVYVQQSAAQAAPAQTQGDWYYCAASRTYYPYTNECPAGWQRVPAQPVPR